MEGGEPQGIWTCGISTSVDQSANGFNMAVGCCNMDGSVSRGPGDIRIRAKVQEKGDARLVAAFCCDHEGGLEV